MVPSGERFVPDKAIILRIPENAIGSEAVFAPDRHVDGCTRQHRGRGLGTVRSRPLALFHFYSTRLDKLVYYSIIEQKNSNLLLILLASPI